MATDPPVTENFALSSDGLAIVMETIFSATLNIMDSLRVSLRRVDDLGRLVFEGAHWQTRSLEVPQKEVVLQTQNGKTSSLGHFIPGYEKAPPAKCIKWASNALRIIVGNPTEREAEMTLESQLINPTKSRDNKMLTGLSLTWKLSWNPSAVEGIKKSRNALTVSSRLVVIGAVEEEDQNVGRGAKAQSSAETVTNPSLLISADTANSSVTETRDSKASAAGCTLKTEEPKDSFDSLSISRAKSGGSNQDVKKREPEA